VANSQTIIKGYIKTENVILLLVAALALGFVSGVVFSVYRSNPAAMLSNGTSAPQMTPQQKKMFDDLIARTKNNPQDIAAWTELGHLYFDTGQSDMAIESYETSLKLDANRPDVWTDLGVMYRRAGNPPKAIECFDHALAHNPNHQIAQYNKGVVLMHDLEDPAGALSAWERLVIMNPDAKTPTGEPLSTIIEQLKQTIQEQEKGPGN